VHAPVHARRPKRCGRLSIADGSQLERAGSRAVGGA
jgi:hypothetical protein